mmetsp:Transcript_17085/g.59813  ORF Transcript_17085/g.59813 Transcript_17085/m.59813 type:complete len:223 (+) Transcript_17085:911-1579(+)
MLLPLSHIPASASAGGIQKLAANPAPVLQVFREPHRELAMLKQDGSHGLTSCAGRLCHRSLKQPPAEWGQQWLQDLGIQMVPPTFAHPEEVGEVVHPQRLHVPLPSSNGNCPNLRLSSGMLLQRRCHTGSGLGTADAAPGCFAPGAAPDEEDLGVPRHEVEQLHVLHAAMQAWPCEEQQVGGYETALEQIYGQGDHCDDLGLQVPSGSDSHCCLPLTIPVAT